MSEIIQNRTGCCIKTIDKTDRQVMRIFFWSQFVCLVPFWITDWATLFATPQNIEYDICLSAMLDSLTYLDLYRWLWADGLAKLLTFFLVLLITLLDTQSMSRSYVAFTGILIRLFYLFDFAWTIVGSVMFWGYHRSFYPVPFPVPQFSRTYTLCSAPFKGYIFFLLIFSYIIIPINLYISSLRPISHFKGQILMGSARAGQTTRRDTQLIEKPKLTINQY